MANTERLKRLQTILEHGVEANKHFNIDWWADCVAGWALQDGTFMKDGLHSYQNVPYYKTFNGFEALGAFFKLSRSDIFYLFGNKSGPQSAQTAISRIDMVLLKHEKITVWFPAIFGWIR